MLALDWELGDWHIARESAEWIELIAIIVIVIAVVIACWSGVTTRLRAPASDAIRAFKRQISRGLLVGLDLLIAADIIRTVTLDATIESAIVLGILVVVRTFLAWTLVVEAENRWPWQPRRKDAAPVTSPPPSAGVDATKPHDGDDAPV